jgi:hypothetical protein
MYAKTPTPTIDAALPMESADLRRALRDGIQTPLSALQAALEDLAKETPGTDQHRSVLCNAALSVERISRRAQTLADFTLEPTPSPMPCTLGELAHGAHRSTPSELRPSVRLALEDPHERMFIDGPLCSRLLSYLLHACAEFHDEALFHVHKDRSQAVFTIICAPLPSSAKLESQHSDNTRRHVNDLMFLVAERELARMGGSVDRSSSTTSIQSISVRLPLDPGLEAAS